MKNFWIRLDKMGILANGIHNGKLIADFNPGKATGVDFVHSYDCSCATCKVARKSPDYVWRAPGHRQVRLEKLAHRKTLVETGLSNPAYLVGSPAAGLTMRPDPRTPESVSFRMVVKPSRVTFKFTDALTDGLTPAAPARGAARGAITEFSESSRSRLADRALVLQELGYPPKMLLTGTAPANFEQIYYGKTRKQRDYAIEIYEIDGKRQKRKTPISDWYEVPLQAGEVFKLQLNIFRHRLNRFLVAFGIKKWSGLWFLEFQKRGAPHIHLMLFNMEYTEQLRRALIKWFSVAWAEIMHNPDEKENKKHIKAGTRVEKMKKSHFGYAVKYASKMEQKTVPQDFVSVGRFWGVWNMPQYKSLEIDLSYTQSDEKNKKDLRSMLYGALSTVSEFAPDFCMSRMIAVKQILGRGLRGRYTFSVFGGGAVASVLAWLGVTYERGKNDIFYN